MYLTAGSPLPDTSSSSPSPPPLTPLDVDDVPHIQNGWTALMWASTRGYLEVVKALVAAGADVNAKNKVGVCGRMGYGVWGPLNTSSGFHHQCASMKSMKASVKVWTLCLI